MTSLVTMTLPSPATSSELQIVPSRRWRRGVVLHALGKNDTVVIELDDLNTLSLVGEVARIATTFHTGSHGASVDTRREAPPRDVAEAREPVALWPPLGWDPLYIDRHDLRAAVAVLTRVVDGPCDADQVRTALLELLHLLKCAKTGKRE